MYSLVIAISSFALILLFWAVVLIAIIFKNPETSMIATSPYINPVEYYYAFIGAIFGMGSTLGGLWLASRSKSRQSRKKLIERIQFNSDRLNQILGYFQNGGLPNFTLDTPGLVAWLHSSADVIGETLSVDIDWHRYQLDHIKIKLDIIYNKVEYDFNDPTKMSEALRRSLGLAAGFGLLPHITQELVRGENLIKRLQKE